ncbi:hypothetical protein O181_054673 [Austropuccinia psidii MF-1]|uniref:Uncharacterized protein n=1 Tax=Austropuccinia psidii MF-1 TaxID=1389203 RepID=A0A9Q3HRN1_9BASI|nr:hypothetical protein [Austropuccinia psidii MF-1]
MPLPIRLLILEKGWNPRLPQDSLRKDLAKIHTTDASFKEILDKAREHSVKCIENSFSYAKDKWDKSHVTLDFSVGDWVLVSTTNFNNIKGCKKIKGSFLGASVVKATHGENSIAVEFPEELNNKHPTLSVSLINLYKSGYAGKFPLRNKLCEHIPPVESSGTKKIATKLLRRFRHTRNNNITK